MIPMLLACTSGAPYAEDPVITNHVDDWRDEVIYQLLTDRFADGDATNNWNVTHDPTNLARHMGGDWQGVIDRADYLEALGVTTVWISPVVTNVEEDAGVAGYHGYWAQDFTQPNPHFGDLATLREMVEILHDRDIKVVVDIVVNHIGQLFYYDINQNGQADITTWYSTDGSDTLDVVTEWDPGYDPRGIQGFTSLGESGPAPLGWVDMPELNRVPPVPNEFWNDDWYKKKGRVTDWDDDLQVEEGDFPGGLKDLETLNPNVQAALVDVYADWITHTNIDGFRVDTIKHVEHEFWEVWCAAIREHALSLGKENFVLFGEAFDGDDALIGSYTAPGMLDSVAYFSQKYAGFDAVFLRGGAPSGLVEVWDARAANWGGEAQPGGVGVAPVDLPVNFLDNHDVPRFLHEGDEAALRLALAVLLTEPGLPVLYYGTEQGLAGGNDPSNREPLWATGYVTDGALFTWIAELNALRRSREALRRGDLVVREAASDGPGLLAYERATQDDRVLVLVNTADVEVTATFDVGFEAEATLSTLAGGSEPVDVALDGTVTVTVGAREARVLGEAG